MSFSNEMLDKKVWAVVGATTNEEKFGYKIYAKLKEEGYEVVGINPNYDLIDADKMYASLDDAMKEHKIECVSVVVPASVSKSVLEKADSLGIPYIWFQPHTYEEEYLKTVETKGIKMVYGQCVLIELGKK